MSEYLSTIRGSASGKILFDEADLPLLTPYSWSIGSHGYAQGCGNGVKIMLMHRYFMAPIPPGMIVDHINRVRLDNRRANLRVVTPTESNMNRSVTGGGIYPHREKFVVQVSRHRVNHYLGIYATREEAQVARDTWADEYDRSYL